MLSHDDLRYIHKLGECILEICFFRQESELQNSINEIIDSLSNINNKKYKKIYYKNDFLLFHCSIDKIPRHEIYIGELSVESAIKAENIYIYQMYLAESKDKVKNLYRLLCNTVVRPSDVLAYLPSSLISKLNITYTADLKLVILESLQKKAANVINPILVKEYLLT